MHNPEEMADCLGFASSTEQRQFIEAYQADEQNQGANRKARIEQRLNHPQAAEALLWFIGQDYCDGRLKGRRDEEMKDIFSTCFEGLIDSKIILRIVRHLAS
jgi:hypothetical protein